jgi:hypothetical protein
MMPQAVTRIRSACSMRWANECHLDAWPASGNVPAVCTGFGRDGDCQSTAKEGTGATAVVPD